jgi:hypothetical protein
MAQRMVIRSFTLQGIKAKAICSELVLMYEPDALVLSIVTKWQKPFSEGRRDLFDDPSSGRPFTHGHAEAIALFKGLCRNLRIERAICLRIPHICLGLTTFHLHTPDRRTRRVKERRLQVVFWRHWRKRNQSDYKGRQRHSILRE